MSPFKINVFYYIIFIIIAVVHSLIELPNAEDNNIAVTESIIRNTVNNLFSTLRLKDAKRKPRLKQFSTIHNFFASLTLSDHDNLNEIVRLTRGKYVDNTSVVTKPLNELLNEDNNDEASDVTVTVLVEAFLNKLRNLKEKYNGNKLSGDTIVNRGILNILEVKNDFNFTNKDIGLEYEDNVLDEFWRESGRRIYKGTVTKSKHFPFMASVQFFGKFQCAGSIIKSDLVITAASCLQLAFNNRFFRENPAFLTVNIGSRFYQGGGENIPILEIYFHPSYDPRNLVNNLALMRMIRHIDFKHSGKKVKKIDIDRNSAPLSGNTDGITIVGWGARESSNILNDPWNSRLSYAVLDFYPLRECREIYTKEYVTKTNFCAGFLSKGGGACNRDVGGPGVVHGMLTGVVSFGSPVCGAADAPTVFTKLGYYTEWIEELMEQDVPANKRRTTLKPVPTIPTLPPPEASPTTFKVEPVSGRNATPIPADAPGLRMQEESEIFHEFLATMFGSKEMKEYGDLIDDLRQNAIDETTEPTGENATEDTPITEVIPTTEALPIPEQPHRATKPVPYVDSQETSRRPSRYTVLDHNEMSSVEKEIENEFVHVFGNIDDTNLVNKPNAKFPKKKSTLGSPRKHVDSVKDIARILDDNQDLVNFLKEPKGEFESENSVKNETSDSNKNRDDSVLTLLYLTDNEKKNQDMDSDSEEGLSIPVGRYENITFRQNRTDDNKLVDEMSKNDLLSLLSEAIDLEMKENYNKVAVAN